MKASLLNLRRSPSRILQAIENRQEVTLTRRGKPFARIVPFRESEGKRVSDHAAFGMWRDREDLSVDAQVRELRRGRGHDL